MQNKILFVENDPHFQTAVINRLDLMDVPQEQIICAHDVASAKQAWDAHKGEIGAVLTDGNYPGGAAYSVIRYIRGEDINMPIVLISAGAVAWREEISEHAVEDPKFHKVPVINKDCWHECKCGKCGPEGQEGFITLVLKTLADQAAVRPGRAAPKAGNIKPEPV